LAFFQSFERLLFLLGRFETVYIVNIAGKIIQALLECLIMLKCQDSSRHQYSCLFTVTHSFESSADSYLCFTKAHITTNQPVHWCWLFHIPLYIYSCFALVGRILVKERSFQLCLQITIGCMCKALRCFS